MAVRYITVKQISKLFKPATRAFGDVAIVGESLATAAGPMKIPVPVTNPDAVTYRAETTLAANLTAAATTLTVASPALFPPAVPFAIRIEDELLTVTAVAADWTVTRAAGGTTAAVHPAGSAVLYAVRDADVGDLFDGPLGRAVRTALEQTPGPTTVWAVRTNPADGANTLRNALREVAKLNVQIVVLADSPLEDAASAAAIEELASHVSTVSNTGGDGKERIGVAMLGKGETNTGLVTSKISIDRMVVVAHHSDDDAAAAVAGAIAGHEPHISLLLKPVQLQTSSQFSDSEIEAFDTARINWLTDPTLIPGRGLFMGEGYTLGVDMPYIDIVRTMDDVSFRIKAQLIRSIGDLRVSRSGLRTLASQLTAVLEPLRQREVIEGYEVFLPLLVLLDKDPTSLTDVELQQINDAQNSRTVDAIVTVDYAGAIHRLNIDLVFK